MTKRLYLCSTAEHDPYVNLALEQRLVETVQEGSCILFLWQNDNTVVIGRNQCAWKECRIEALQEDGGHLARRQSGGGAVFHDLGNLNFSFITPQEDSDVRRQLRVVQRACGALGIQTQLSGRNDLTTDGRKFSGNAFYTHQGHSLHHGTILIDVDAARMSRYLSPSKAKLEAKSVDSVRSRVVNLRELAPSLTVEAMWAQMEAAFPAEYQLPVQRLSIETLMDQRCQALAERNRSWEWNYGQRIPAAWTAEARFAWGGLELSGQITDGTVTGVQVFTDALDTTISEQLKTALTGCTFRREALCQAVEALNWSNDLTADVCSLF